MGGFEAWFPDQVEPSLKYHSSQVFLLTPGMGRQRLVGSLTGAVASQKVTEAPKGLLKVDGNHLLSALV